MLAPTWDYTDRAKYYDKRADYSDSAVHSVLSSLSCSPGQTVADIGAGTGKLTKMLLKFGLQVKAVEPNDAMRGIGSTNESSAGAHWTKGMGEETGLPSKSVQAAFFGSSFNVLDQKAALKEVDRIVVPRGGFACMWNHRDLSDPVQDKIESTIKGFVPSYSYGTRREDPTSVVSASGIFENVEFAEGNFKVQIDSSEFFEGWKSHATLARQAGDQFAKVIEAIGDIVMANRTLEVPYTTRIWYCRKKA